MFCLTVERYDTLTGVWSSCPPMNTRRRYCRLAVLDHCIYSIGGYDSTQFHCSVERVSTTISRNFPSRHFNIWINARIPFQQFDPRVGRWSTVPSMSSKRSSVGVATLDGELFCVGGNDGTMCMASGERFNARRNSWEPIAAMETRRYTDTPFCVHSQAQFWIFFRFFE